MWCLITLHAWGWLLWLASASFEFNQYGCACADCSLPLTSGQKDNRLASCLRCGGSACRDPNKCWQAWSGVVAKPAFPARFLVTSCKSDMAARLVLEEHGVGQYWDVCKASVQQQQ